MKNNLFEKLNVFVKKSSYNNKLFKQKKVIFIHVPKVAGNGVLKSLGINKTGHVHLHTYELENYENFISFFKIGFVRNPWDRIVSAYHYLSHGGDKNEYDLYMQKKLERFKDFQEFVQSINENSLLQKEMLKEIHFKPQYSWMMNSIGEIEMDYIGYFEDLETGFEILKDKLDKPYAKLNKYNSSNHNPYWSYYNLDTVKIVEELYKKDIELFGYEFPNNKLKDAT